MVFASSTIAEVEFDTGRVRIPGRRRWPSLIGGKDMDSPEWKKIIGAVAPALATALGGPLAGAAVTALSSAVLGRPDGDEAQIAAAVASGGADTVKALKQAEAEFLIEMRRIDLDVERLHQADRSSARQANVDGDTQSRVFWLTCVIFCVVIGVEAAVLLIGLPPGTDQQMAGRILGTLDAALLAALYYTYGSSSGSARKDAILRERS